MQVKVKGNEGRSIRKTFYKTSIAVPTKSLCLKIGPPNQEAESHALNFLPILIFAFVTS